MIATNERGEQNAHPLRMPREKAVRGPSRSVLLIYYIINLSPVK